MFHQTQSATDSARRHHIEFRPAFSRIRRYFQVALIHADCHGLLFRVGTDASYGNRDDRTRADLNTRLHRSADVRLVGPGPAIVKAFVRAARSPDLSVIVPL